MRTTLAGIHELQVVFLEIGTVGMAVHAARAECLGGNVAIDQRSVFFVDVDLRLHRIFFGIDAERLVRKV